VGGGRRRAGAGGAEGGRHDAGGGIFLKHCLEAFRGGLIVHTAIEHLVWSHRDRPAEVRAMATEFFVANGRAIRVSVFGPVCVLLE
jgi:hypothetical protein